MQPFTQMPVSQLPDVHVPVGPQSAAAVQGNSLQVPPALLQSASSLQPVKGALPATFWKHVSLPAIFFAAAFAFAAAHFSAGVAPAPAGVVQMRIPTAMVTAANIILHI